MSKVTAKYQITLLVKVRNELGIVPGVEVDIEKKGTKYENCLSWILCLNSRFSVIKSDFQNHGFCDVR